MERLPPEPITGFDAATSGVAQPQPKPVAENRRIVHPETILSPEWIREVRMVQDVEKFGSKLCGRGAP